MKYDVAIIGLGPSGIKFAQECLKKGLKTIAFEKASVGGTCLNVGCIPTKTFLSCAEAFLKLKNCTKYGIVCDNLNPNVSYESICKKKDGIVTKFSQAVAKDLTFRGLEIKNSVAKLYCKGSCATVIADNIEYQAEKIFVSTGSKPFELPAFKFDSHCILSSDDMLKCQELPKSMLIIGSGAIGVEWARILNSFGVDVTVVEKAQSLLPQMDKDISSRIERMFKMSKIKFFKSATLDSFSSGVVTLSDGKKFDAQKVLCAIGRVSVLPEITDDFKLIINDDCSTNLKNVYVIGDASGKTMLAHYASYQAKALFDSVYNNKEFKQADVPSVVYGSPEIASIGVREQDIDENELKNYKIYKLPLAFLPKSWCDDSTDGFIKIITKDDCILGAHIVSNEASALIMQISIAMKAKMKVQDLEEVIFPHPTYSEGILEAIING